MKKEKRGIPLVALILIFMIVIVVIILFVINMLNVDSAGKTNEMDSAYSTNEERINEQSNSKRNTLPGGVYMRNIK